MQQPLFLLVQQSVPDGVFHIRLDDHRRYQHLLVVDVFCNLDLVVENIIATQRLQVQVQAQRFQLLVQL